MSTRVTSSRLIGRTAELAELEAALADAAAGRPSLAFVAGESGVGKTRLLTELERRAREGGVRVIGGDCVDLGEGELPYAPLVAALRPLVREGDPVLDQLSAPARAELATLLPELGAAAPAARSEEEGGAAQGHLFEALLSLLDRLGDDAPVLLTLEDIHWADRSTRSFLAFVARSLCAERVLTVATYRSDELHRRHPLRPLLAELERAQRARRVEVCRLERDELEALLADILGATPQPELVDRMWRRSEGNPLFTEELLAAGLDGRGTLPPTLRDALMVRIEALGEAAEETLRLLATARRADHELLADAGGLDARTLRDALREAVAHHIVSVSDEGHYAFRHALLREVVHDDLLPGERVELHLALARALERRAEAHGGGAWVTAGIAHHYRAAGDQPAALRASLRAAEEAVRVLAYGEAAALLERVLELWDRVPEAEELAGSDRAAILRRAADAHRLEGDDIRRTTLLERALSEVEAGGDTRRRAVLLGELATAQWGLGRGDDSRATLRRALELLPAGEASPERARLLARQAKFLMLQSRFRETIAAAEEAQAAARAVGDERILTTVLDGLGVALLGAGEHDRGVQMLRRAIEISRRGGDNDDRATLYVNLGDALHLSGRSKEAVAVVEEGLAEIPMVGRHARWLQLLQAEIALDLGADWKGAAALLPAGETRYIGTTRVNLNLRRAELALGQGEAALARSLLDEIDAELVNSIEPQRIGVAGALRAELERRDGDLDAARAAATRAIDRIQFCSEDTQRLARVATAGIAVEADAAQRARDLGEASEERAATKRAAMLLDHVRALAAEGQPVELAYRATAEAEVTRARGRSDPKRWARAAAAWSKLDRRYVAATAQWREAEAHVVAGDREAATPPAQAALAVANELGARWLSGEVEGLAARARLRLGDDGAPAVEADGEGSEDPFGLTPRERQVLALVARGATNREIGAELFMAEKTASVHVSRILSKLSVRTRTEAAALAHRQGLETG